MTSPSQGTVVGGRIGNSHRREQVTLQEDELLREGKKVLNFFPESTSTTDDAGALFRRQLGICCMTF